MNISDEQSAPNLRMRLRNKRERPLVVVLEPWANEYQVPPDSSLEILEEGGDVSEPLDIQLEGEHVVIFARSGSTLRAYFEGRELP